MVVYKITFLISQVFSQRIHFARHTAGICTKWLQLLLWLRLKATSSRFLRDFFFHYLKENYFLFKINFSHEDSCNKHENERRFSIESSIHINKHKIVFYYFFIVPTSMHIYIVSSLSDYFSLPINQNRKRCLLIWAKFTVFI